VVVTLLVTAAFLAVGYAGYQRGNSSAVDLSSVRAEAVAEGREEGTREAEAEGFAAGLRATQDREYPATYAAAYREAYVREFEDAGLTPPESIPVPEQP
jgi:hypothetical protein